MAYRAGEKLTNERDGITHDYTHKQGVEHAEIVLPEGVKAEWARDRSALWNAAELAEKRKDARVAREFEVALPHELSVEERLEATREIAQELANRYGAAVDFAIHAPHEAGDVRNHHAHILMTTRQVGAEGLGDKTYLERENKWLLTNGLPTTDMQLRDIRQSWEGIASERMAAAGLDIRIDHRSHLERGLEIAPSEHMGVHATQMQRKGMDVARVRLDQDAAKRNAELIREKPEQVLFLITGEKSVFDRHDVARALHRYINDDAQAFQNAFATVMASPALVELQAERVNGETGEVELARYSTREMVEIESRMVASAQRLHQAHSHGLSDHHGVDRRHVARAIGAQDAAIQQSAGDASARLSDEQRRAIKHITGPERIAAVVGLAGAGKSTMLAAAREAWEAEGYTVHGAALSGKAAEGLEESSGIRSRTLASWSRGWDNDRGTLGRGDVFVIDEAGMVGSRQLSRFVSEIEARGAKIVLVGDHEQLQAIGAGAPFRAIAEEIGHAELSEIRRQRVDWQREASASFATHCTELGLRAYAEHGDLRFSETRDGARGEIVRDYLADRDQRPDGTRVAMAHRRADVRAINADIRAALQDRGELARGDDAGALTFQTNDGKREFAPGDRIVFLENNRELGVKNGMLGTVAHVDPERIVATLDGRGGESVSVPMASYQAVDHGYATTIHKNQGATVDRSFVMASGTMDRHLTYVAMTRHRDGAQLYAGMDEFSDRQGLAAGRLVEHGAAPYEHREGGSRSYFVTLETEKGQRHTTWGVDLERAMTEAQPQIGDRIGLQHRGSQPVRLPDGTQTERHAWAVRDAGELAYARLESRLSRSGVKETTLDYVSDFAERRGIAERMGVASEIEIPRERAELRPDREAAERSDPSVEKLSDRSQTAQLTPATTGVGGAAGRGQAPVVGSSDKVRSPVAKNKGEDLAQKTGRDLAQDLRADPRADLAADRQQQSRGAAERSEQDRAGESGPQSEQTRPEKAETRRRGMFDGLKLNVRSQPSRERGGASADGRPEREGSLRPAPAPDRLADRLRPSDMERAVDRFAHALDAAHRNAREGLPVLEAQKNEIQAAGQGLDKVRPGSHALMRSALQHDPQTERAVTELSGRARAGQLMAGMERERAALADPNVRAARFVNRWQDLQGQREKLHGWQNDEARQKITGQMQGMAQSLERDPQMESILRGRSRELGIHQYRERQSEGIAHELTQSLARGRGQSLGR